MYFIKRFVGVIICAFFIASIIFHGSPVKAYTDEIDQYCYSGSSDKMGLNAYTMFQTFEISYKYVTRIAVFIQGSGSTKTMVGPDKDGHFYEGTITGPSDPDGDWVVFTPSHPLEVIPGHQVVIYLYSTTDLPLYWFYRDDSCYANGTMWFLPGPTEMKSNRDMGFISYGTDSIEGDDTTPGDDSDTTPADDDSANDTSDNTTDNTTTTGDNNAPGTVDTNKLVVSSFKVNKSLSAPPELKATQFFISKGPNVKLNWKEPDTKNIDGYNIYRQGPNEEKFTKISSTKTGIPTYIDQNVAIGKKYNYVVRSYAKESESLNSNEASITITAKKVATVAKPLKWYQKIPWLSWWMVLIYLIIATGIGLLIFWLIKRHKKKQQGITSYSKLK